MWKILSKLVRFVLVAVVVCNGYGSVLCFGSDGHVAIEPVFHDHCGHDHDHHPHSGTAHSHDADSHLTDSCSPCEDVIIVSDLELTRSKNVSQCIFVSSAVNLTDVADLLEPHCYQRTVGSFSYFTPLKTIILLT